MAVATFDTLKFSNSLKAAGVPDRQAEAETVLFAEMFSTNFRELATKEDLKIECGLVRTELKTEITSLRTELKGEIALLRVELKNESRELEQRQNAKMELSNSNMRADMLLLKWMFTSIIGFLLALLIRSVFYPHVPF